MNRGVFPRNPNGITGEALSVLIVWRDRTNEAEAGNVGNGTSGMERTTERARVDEMEAQRVRAPFCNLLQKALGPKTYDWIDHYRHGLPPEYPPGHRKAYCRIAQMHHPHSHPPIRLDPFTFRGGTSLNPIGTIATSLEIAYGTSVPAAWHGSNRGNARVNRC